MVLLLAALAAVSGVVCVFLLLSILVAIKPTERKLHEAIDGLYETNERAIKAMEAGVEYIEQVEKELNRLGDKISKG